MVFKMSQGISQQCSASASVKGTKRGLTEDDAVELVGAGVVVGQQNAAGLQHGQELRLSWLCEGGQEGVGALGDALLQHCRVVSHCVHILHTPATPNSELEAQK